MESCDQLNGPAVLTQGKVPWCPLNSSMGGAPLFNLKDLENIKIIVSAGNRTTICRSSRRGGGLPSTYWNTVCTKCGDKGENPGNEPRISACRI